MASADIRDRVDAIYNDATQLANARDYLNMLASSEGTAGRGDRGYNVMFRGDLISDYSRHPNMMHTYTDKNGKQGGSTAAGRYQFLYKTYDAMAKRLGITDFSPESQDKVAIALMLEKGVDFSDGADFGRNVAKINNVWTSLAGSSLGMQHHSVRSFQQNLDAFNQSRHSRGMSPVASFWDKTTYQTDPASLTTGMSQADMQSLRNKAQSYLESIGITESLLGRPIADINSKIYSAPGAIPFQMYSGNKFTVSSDPNLTDQNVSAMAARLHNTDPNALYGVSVTSNGIVGTANLTQPAPAQTQTVTPVVNNTPAPVTTRQGLPTAQPKTPVSGASNGGASTPQAPATGAPQTMVYPKSEDYHTGEIASGGMVRWDPATGNVNVAQPVVTQYRTGTPQSLAEVPNASGVSDAFAGLPAIQNTGYVRPVKQPLSDYELEQKVLQLGNANAVIPTSSGLPDANRTAVVPERPPVVTVPPEDIVPVVVPTTQQETGSGDVAVGAWVIPTGSNGIPQFQNTSVDALRDLLDQTQIKQRDLPTFRPVEL